jgi:hypothetical protein
MQGTVVRYGDAMEMHAGTAAVALRQKSFSWSAGSTSTPVRSVRTVSTQYADPFGGCVMEVRCSAVAAAGAVL